MASIALRAAAKEARIAQRFRAKDSSTPSIARPKFPDRKACRRWTSSCNRRCRGSRSGTTRPTFDGEQESPIAENGLVGTRARVFDRSGKLLASGGAQLLCVE
jgi:hypothetical protein